MYSHNNKFCICKVFWMYPTKQGRCPSVVEISQYLPSFGGVRTFYLSSSIFLQEILPCGQGRIGSVKINPSLLMMRECDIQCLLLCHFPLLLLSHLCFSSLSDRQWNRYRLTGPLERRWERTRVRCELELVCRSTLLSRKNIYSKPRNLAEM